MKPLAMTGVGVVSPLGVGFEAFASGLQAVASGQSPTLFRAPESFSVSEHPNAAIAEVRGFDPASVLGDKGLRNLDRLTKLLLVASRLAGVDASLKRDGTYVGGTPERTGICGSTAYGSIETMDELNRVAVLENPRYLNPSKFPNTVINAALGYVSIWDDYRALNATVCNGNCGALDALFCATMYLESRRADAILVGGGEAMHEALYVAFDRIGALSDASKPFAPGQPNSAGFRLGEGASFVVLENAERAHARSANIRGYLRGYGTAFAPPRSEALVIHFDTNALETAIREALRDASLEAHSINAVVACGDGYARYDAVELEVLKRVFSRLPSIAFPKAIVGETLGASGAMGVATALAWMSGHAPGVLFDAEVTATSPNTVLVIALGFYGNASAVVLSRDAAAPNR